jgi:hypothetical protein
VRASVCRRAAFICVYHSANRISVRSRLSESVDVCVLGANRICYGVDSAASAVTRGECVASDSCVGSGWIG